MEKKIKNKKFESVFEYLEEILLENLLDRLKDSTENAKTLFPTMHEAILRPIERRPLNELIKDQMLLSAFLKMSRGEELEGWKKIVFDKEKND